jgi:hypothetical protein
MKWLVISHFAPNPLADLGVHLYMNCLDCEAFLIYQSLFYFRHPVHIFYRKNLAFLVPLP